MGKEERTSHGGTEFTENTEDSVTLPNYAFSTYFFSFFVMKRDKKEKCGLLIAYLPSVRFVFLRVLRVRSFSIALLESIELKIQLTRRQS